MRLLCSLAATCLATVGLWAVEVGQPAPALEGLTMIKGEEPQALDAGTVSVVELWATWCAPCRVSIPHLTQLQKQHGDAVQIIGISREDVPTITPFVEDFGDKMDYHVAAVGEDLYETYGQNVRGIPFAYIVDGSGTVVWKGHPMQMDEPLNQVVSGTFDPDQAAAIAAARQTLEESFESNNPAQIAAANKELLALDPLNAMGIDVGMRLAEFQEDKAAFQALFNSVPVADMNKGQAGRLLQSMLNFNIPHWLNPQSVATYAERTIADDQPQHLLTAAQAAHFLGDIERAHDLAKQADAAEVSGASEWRHFFATIKDLQD